MIKLRKRKVTETPQINLSPLIDMSFLLLVFFIFSTMYMSELKTVPVQLPVAENSQMQTKARFTVTVKNDGAVWLDDKLVPLNILIERAKVETKKDKNFAIILRADGDVNYSTVIKILDKLKGAGLTRVGLAVKSEA
jgi:biopolymer transport protein ExbD